MKKSLRVILTALALGLANFACVSVEDDEPDTVTRRTTTTELDTPLTPAVGVSRTTTTTTY